MILSDKEINKYVSDVDLIHPFEEKQLTPNGYDVSIEEIELINDVKLLLVDGKYQIPRKMSFIVLTKEKVSMPKNIVGRLSIKTKYARKGFILSPGVVDAGFVGKLNLCFYNANEDPVLVEKGKPIVQLVFERMADGSAKAYAERSGNYQDQDRIIK
jgi:dCTP deaminase